MARNVCGISFRTKRGTTAAREIRRFLWAALILASVWLTHSILYLSWISVVPCFYALAVVFAIVTCWIGASTRSSSTLYVFHVGMACTTAILALSFLAVFVAFVLLGATQFIVQSDDWSLDLDSVSKNRPCTDRLPLNNSKHTGDPDLPRFRHPIPLGCDFYYNMRGQQITVFLVVVSIAGLLSCMLCMQGFQIFEVVAGPQLDPEYESMMESARGRLESLLNVDGDIEDSDFDDLEHSSKFDSDADGAEINQSALSSSEVLPF